jgi:hypothetical protein
VWARLSALFKPPRPTGPPRTVRAFGPSDLPITRDGVSPEGNGWRIDAREPRTVRLFEVASPGVEQCVLTYRARMKSVNVQGPAYLEMWCRFPGRGEFFSKGIPQAVTGTTDWASYETPFFLKQGQRPDLIKLNLAVQGSGTVWIDGVALLATSLQ